MEKKDYIRVAVLIAVLALVAFCFYQLWMVGQFSIKSLELRRDFYEQILNCTRCI